MKVGAIRQVDRSTGDLGVEERITCLAPFSFWNYHKQGQLDTGKVQGTTTNRSNFPTLRFKSQPVSSRPLAHRGYTTLSFSYADLQIHP